MNMQDLRDIMGLTQAQVAEELGVPKQDVIDCEENGETYLLLQFISAFPINPQILKDPDVDPFLPTFDQTTPGHRMRAWREQYNISAEDMAAALGITPEELLAREADPDLVLIRRRGEEIEKKTGINRKWLMYGDGREKGVPRLVQHAAPRPKEPSRGANPAPNRPAGLRVKEARQNAGLSREQLADLLHLSVSRVAQMESGYIRDEKAEHILRRIASASDAPVKEDPRAAGLRVREARKAAGLSVREAAELAQLKPATLAHLESGYITPKRADELVALFESSPASPASPAFSGKEAGARIREERLQAGLSQKELGTILRLPVTRVSHIELGDVTEEQYQTILRRLRREPRRPVQARRVRPADQVLLGSNIRDAREAAKLSQKSLGEMLDLPQTRISLMERGKVDEATGRRILRMLQDVIDQKKSEEALPLVQMAKETSRTAVPARSSRVPRPDLAQRIREARTAAGLSQKRLGELMNLSQGGISYLEQGRVDEATAEKALRLIEEEGQVLSGSD